MREITICSRMHSAHQISHFSMFRQGLDALGIDSEVSMNPVTKYVVCWGWKSGKMFRDMGHEVIVMERGYIGDRFKYTSLGWNGLNNHAEFPEYPADKGERFKKHGGILKPWKKDGDYILILGQVRGDASLKGQDITNWYQQVAQEATDRWNLPVHFRPHPESRRRGGYSNIQGFTNMGGTLEEALSGALFTVAYNSNSCLDSILAGVPCFAGDRGTMAWDLCMENIGTLQYPKREDVVNKIAWTQWEEDEIKTGVALRGLIESRNIGVRA